MIIIIVIENMYRLMRTQMKAIDFYSMLLLLYYRIKRHYVNGVEQIFSN